MRGFCEFTNRKRRPQRGCTTSDAQNANLLRIDESQTSTSTRMHHFRCPDCEASANLRRLNIDLHEDATLRTPRIRSFCKFTNLKRRPQRGCPTSDAQNARPLRTYESQTSTSTRIPHFGCPECEASRNLRIANVDLNEDAPLRMPRMRSLC